MHYSYMNTETESSDKNQTIHTGTRCRCRCIQGSGSSWRCRYECRFMLLKTNKLLGFYWSRKIEKLMPKKIETKILCLLSSTQVFWYKGFLMDDIETLWKLSDNETNESQKKHLMLRDLIMKLRKCCLHPIMFDFAEADVDKTSVEELWQNSGRRQSSQSHVQKREPDCDFLPVHVHAQ